MWTAKHFMAGYFLLLGVFIVSLLLKSLMLGVIMSIVVAESALVMSQNEEWKTGLTVGMIGFGFAVVIGGLALYSLGVRSVVLYIVSIALLSAPIYYGLHRAWIEMEKV